MDENKKLENTLTTDTNIEEVKEENKDIYGGTFHERDSLAENNIVNEVKDSFLEYSMSVITSPTVLADFLWGLSGV